MGVASAEEPASFGFTKNADVAATEPTVMRLRLVIKNFCSVIVMVDARVHPR